LSQIKNISFKGAGKPSSGSDSELSDTDLCLKFLDRHLRDVIRTKKGRQSLLLLSKEPLIEILQRDSLTVRAEYDLFLLAAAWSNAQVKKELQQSSETKDTQDGENKDESKLDPDIGATFPFSFFWGGNNVVVC
jgi:hypothetical protein